MGYQLSISRGYRWAEDQSFEPISLAEWNKVIDELCLERVDHRDVTNPATGEVIRVMCPESALASADGPLLTWSKGVLNIADSPEAVDASRPVAQALAASIYGEEGEAY
jgi:hypothetical protein